MIPVEAVVCRCVEAELSAGNISGVLWEESATHTHPQAVVRDLQSPLGGRGLGGRGLGGRGLWGVD